MGKQQLTLLLRALSIQIKENFIHKWIYTFRLLLPLPSLAQLLLNQDITMDMVMVMDMVDMDTMDTMEREKLSLATTIMAMDMDTDMVDMVTMATMERERLKPPLLLSQDIITTAMDMVMDGGYGHHGYYGKREAEAGYHHGYGHGYGYGGYGHHGYYGKREAEAGYHHGYGHGYGYGGYGHHGYYGKREAEPGYYH